MTRVRSCRFSFRIVRIYYALNFDEREFKCNTIINILYIYIFFFSGDYFSFVDINWTQMKKLLHHRIRDICLPETLFNTRQYFAIRNFWYFFFDRYNYNSIASMFDRRAWLTLNIFDFPDFYYIRIRVHSLK